MTKINKRMAIERRTSNNTFSDNYLGKKRISLGMLSVPSELWGKRIRFVVEIIGSETDESELLELLGAYFKMPLNFKKIVSFEEFQEYYLNKIKQ